MLKCSSCISQIEGERVTRGEGEVNASNCRRASPYAGDGGPGGGGDADGGGDGDGGGGAATYSQVFDSVDGGATELSLSKLAMPPSDAVEARLVDGFLGLLGFLLGFLGLLGFLDVGVRRDCFT